MASVIRDKDGRKRIQFVAAEGRKTIRLGKCTLETARAFNVKVEALLAAKELGHAPDSQTAQWLAQRDKRTYKKLEAVGLVGSRASESKTPPLKQFLDDYIANRGDVKSSTSTVYGHTKRCLLTFFNEALPINRITPGDADKWRTWLTTHEKLADNTMRRRCGIAKQFFRAAVRQRLIAENPFADLKASVRRNEARYYFVSRDEATKVLAACPTAEWRLLFALSRYGGLRCPSEHLALCWDDVDWQRGRFTVHASKTEHHEDGGVRQVPIFPELRPYLEEVRAQAKPDAKFVITRYRDAAVNLRTQLQKIIRRAGLTVWPKLWQNLRSTRETELANEYPLHVVCEWIGNTAAVAVKHYLQTTEEHYRQAANSPESESPKAAQKTAQHTQEPSGTVSHGAMAVESENLPKPLACETLRNETARCDCIGLLGVLPQVGVTGFEPVTSTV